MKTIVHYALSFSIFLFWGGGGGISGPRHPIFFGALEPDPHLNGPAVSLLYIMRAYIHTNVIYRNPSSLFLYICCKVLLKYDGTFLFFFPGSRWRRLLDRDSIKPAAQRLHYRDFP